MIFITGFPGFLTSHLLRRLLTQHPNGSFSLLVVRSMIDRAEQELSFVRSIVPSFQGSIDLLIGDITHPQLGLPTPVYSSLTSSITHVWHLAALYNLAVESSIAHRVNVLGTRHILDLCEASTQLQRLFYISTCYVSGDRKGRIREVELDEGQGFKNHYESTKFLAEVEVRRRLSSIPTTIFRPGIVVGDSRTGEINKYDGPYYIMRLLMDLPDQLPTVYPGRGDSIVNIVPVNFVADAMTHISLQPTTTPHTTFQLADPNPLSSRQVLNLILSTLGRPSPVAHVPSMLASLALKIKPLQSSLRVPHEALVYFNHDAHYETTNTLEALEGSELSCPSLGSYMDTLMHYMRRYPNPSIPARLRPRL